MASVGVDDGAAAVLVPGGVVDLGVVVVFDVCFLDGFPFAAADGSGGFYGWLDQVHVVGEVWVLGVVHDPVAEGVGFVFGVAVYDDDAGFVGDDAEVEWGESADCVGVVVGAVCLCAGGFEVLGE